MNNLPTGGAKRHAERKWDQERRLEQRDHIDRRHKQRSTSREFEKKNMRDFAEQMNRQLGTAVKFLPETSWRYLSDGAKAAFNWEIDSRGKPHFVFKTIYEKDSPKQPKGDELTPRDVQHALDLKKKFRMARLRRAAAGVKRLYRLRRVALALSRLCR
tara:strand:- start:271595 stop:272068 length:474 start_codon:yes stop_codon:yes gene_type:complete